MSSREDQVRAEAELAKRLVQAPDTERARLYGPLYDQIYSMHMQHDPRTLDFGAAPSQIPTLRALTKPNDRVLEIGCGMGLLAIALRDSGRIVTAVDVSQVALDRAADRAGTLQNLMLERVDGIELPFPNDSFDFAYSVEVVEHLHEHDAHSHFAEIARVLRRGGSYWFITPSRYNSAGAAERFGVEIEVDADMHLKEWTHHELRVALREVGFKTVRVPLSHSGRRARIEMPGIVASALERLPAICTSRVGYSLGLNQCVVRAVADD